MEVEYTISGEVIVARLLLDGIFVDFASAQTNGIDKTRGSEMDVNNRSMKKRKQGRWEQHRDNHRPW